MELNLPEIQLTYVVIISLLTLAVAFLVPQHTRKVRDFVVARRLLVVGGTLVAIHFLLQYIIHKNLESVATMRLLLNLLFGFPCSFFFTMSLMFLLRKGQISRKEWLCIPMIYLLALISLGASYVIGIEISQSLRFVVFLYALSLLYCSMLAIKEYFNIRYLQRNGDKSYDMMLKWTSWSIFLMSLTGLGYPFFIILDNVTLRSIYGILSLSIAFIFILGLLGYSLNYNVVQSIKLDKKNRNIKESNKEETSSLLTQNVVNKHNTDDIVKPVDKKIVVATEAFINNLSFTRSGITIADAAKEMDITVQQLKLWLQKTEYGKFNTWITYLRIEYAKKLMLKDPTISNEVVAQKCGICDRQYFQSLFSKIVGVTPSRWVKNQ